MLASSGTRLAQRCAWHKSLYLIAWHRGAVKAASALDMTDNSLADWAEQAEAIAEIDELDHTWDSRLTALEQAIGTLQGIVSALKTDMSSFKKDVSSLQKDMTIVRAGINVLLARPQR